jgi:hypothetical protein
MKRSLRELEPRPSSLGRHADQPIEALAVHVCPADAECQAIHIDSCRPFERIAVRTRMSDYEVVVLPGSSGDVLIRGGRFFRTFHYAGLAGSTFGGSAIRLRTIEVGCRLELQVNGLPIVTSTIEAVSHVKLH